MTPNPQAQLLIWFVFLLAIIAGIAWALMTRPLRVAPKASVRFFITNVLLAIGVYLLLLGQNHSYWGFWLASDLFILSSFATLGWGIQHLFKQPTSALRDSLLLSVCAALMLMLHLTANIGTELGVSFCVTASYLLGQAGRNKFIAIRHHFNSLAASLMAIPLLLTALLFVVRALLLLVLPADNQDMLNHASEQGLPMLWCYVVLILAVNATVFGGALARLVAKIRTMAEHDPLTGLYNRGAVLKRLQQCHENLQKQQIPYGLILLDLDHFKQINDSYGHDAGDAALQQCAATLRSSVRPNDILSRYGGEEFLLVLPDCAEAYVCAVAERVCLAIEQSPLQWQQQQLQLSASLGHIWADPDLTVDQLLSLADKAMYQAKGAGRNTSVKAAQHHSGSSGPL
ncbi:GGDEF domain-containing protein [Rheinheimera marina]|uniref:diguanylate cyclase n=1 Tax=Rheinheimera marina TaxID=1774958 RepID=A0ABV9JN35_9GAMM